MTTNTERTLSISDHSARIRALDTSTSFAVSAPAGSGKTGLLTQRVLALLALCDEPENVLAITFTRKAAAEMQSRIIEAITQAANTPEPEENYLKQTWQLAQKVLQRNEEKQWQLLECPNRLRITTIDSLCRSISERMPFDSLLGSVPEIIDNPNVAYEAATRDTLALIHKQNPLQEDLIRLVKHFDNNLDKVEQLLIQLLAKRDQWLSIILQSSSQRDILESMLQDVLNNELEYTRELLAPVSSELIILADHAAKNFERVELAPKNSQSPIRECLGLHDLPLPSISDYTQRTAWIGISELLTTQGGSVRAKPTKDIGFFAPSNNSLSKEEKETAKVFKTRMEALLAECKNIPNIENQLAIIKQLPTAEYETTQWELLDSLTRILRYLAAALKVTFQQLGKSDYLEITLAAIEALGSDESPSDIALALDYNIQHILIDEFQDTSTTQLVLLKALTRGWQADDGRTLFVVGDAMQSCYRFRDANVGIFLDAREKGIGDIVLEALDLDVNFRSQQGIVEWVNTQFSDLFPAENNSAHGAVKYKPSVSHKAALKGNASEWHLLAPTTQDESESPADQAAYIAQLVKQHKSKHPKDSIAVLVRNKSHAQAIIPELAKVNIDYRATEIDLLNTCMPVRDLLSLTRALLYPHDRMAWVAVLRAPWCGLDMHDLLIATQDTEKPIIKNIEECLTQNQLSSDAHKKLQRFYETLAKGIAQQGRFSLTLWVQRIWLSLGGTALLINPDDAENVARFFEVLEREQQAGTISQWRNLEDAVDRLFAKQTPHSESPVEIMTIHKSKGLEFDMVIIPGLERSSRTSDKELITWMEKPTANGERLLLIAALHAKGRDKDKLYEYIYSQHKEKDNLETDRLLYVACTRAVKKLHLVANIKLEEDTIKTPAKGTLLYRLWHTIDRHTIDKNLPEVKFFTIKNNEKNSHPNFILSLSPEWQKPTAPEQQLLQQYRGNNQLAEVSGDNIATPDALLQREQRYIGTVVHLALQQITDSGYQTWNQERIEQQIPFWRSQLIHHGIAKAQLDNAIEKVINAIKSTLDDEVGCWILDNTHEKSATELAIYNSYGQHIIDRTFIAENDDGSKTRWIIDYKTGTPSQEELEKYRKQLQRYADLFSTEAKANHLPIKTALYFPSSKRLVEM
jgi:ATP-dependent helicase/nuclease subunit A